MGEGRGGCCDDAVAGVEVAPLAAQNKAEEVEVERGDVEGRQPQLQMSRGFSQKYIIGDVDARVGRDEHLHDGAMAAADGEVERRMTGLKGFQRRRGRGGLC